MAPRDPMGPDRNRPTGFMKKILKLFKGNPRMVPGTTIAVTAIFSVFGTFGYVLYRDWKRERRMIDMFATGNLLQPMNGGNHKVFLYRRERDMAMIRHILRSDLTNQYHLVFGEVGSGKTRLITEVVKSLMETNGKQKKGAPIYVLASQGHSFPESFARAVDFHFDEHISLRFVLDYIFRVAQLPETDDKSKMERLLDALEGAAFKYLEETGKPAVLVIDGVDWLTERMPEAITLMQEKAKMWADTHIAKVVFVSNDEKTEEIMQRSHSSWSRAADRIVIGDLSVVEAKEFLNLYDPDMTKATMLCRQRRCKGHPEEGGHVSDLAVKGVDDSHVHYEMSEEYMDRVINLVGGRIQNLLIAKREFLKGSRFDLTASHLKFKEMSKFIEILKSAERRKAIALLRESPNKTMNLSDLIDQTSREDVFTCAFHNVLRIDRDAHSGLTVKFESKLTEVTVEDIFREKQEMLEKQEKKEEQARSLSQRCKDILEYIKSYFT